MVWQQIGRRGDLRKNTTFQARVLTGCGLREIVPCLKSRPRSSGNSRRVVFRDRVQDASNNNVSARTSFHLGRSSPSTQEEWAIRTLAQVLSAPYRTMARDRDIGLRKSYG